MSQIFIVSEFSQDGNSVLGAYSSQELADAALRAWVKMENDWHTESYGDDPEFLDIVIYHEGVDRHGNLAFMIHGSERAGTYALELDKAIEHWSTEEVT